MKSAVPTVTKFKRAISYSINESVFKEAILLLTSTTFIIVVDLEENVGKIRYMCPIGNIRKLESTRNFSLTNLLSKKLVLHTRDFCKISLILKTQSNELYDPIKALKSLLFPLKYDGEPISFLYKKLNLSKTFSVVPYNTNDYYRMLCVQQDDPLTPKGWKINDFNDEFKLCDSYPEKLLMSSDVTEEMLKNYSTCRSDSRFPILSYLDLFNNIILLRSSQLIAGLLNKSNIDDLPLLQSYNGVQRIVIFDARPPGNIVSKTFSGAGYEASDKDGRIEVKTLNLPSNDKLCYKYNDLESLIVNTKVSKPITENLEPVKAWLIGNEELLDAVKMVQDEMVSPEHLLLIHCDEGRDRTSQLISLVMLMHDKYYRTLEGFRVLIMKEWCSAGYNFLKRSPFCSNERKNPDSAPYFLQFIDCVFTLFKNCQNIFQFNETFLIDLMDGFNSGFYGEFLFSSDFERRLANVHESAVSIWYDFDITDTKYINTTYQEYESMYKLTTFKVFLWEKFYLRNRKIDKEKLLNRFPFLPSQFK